MRRRQGFGPHRIGWALGVACSTVYAVLRRFGLTSRPPASRDQRERRAPGDLLHLDVKKLARIPDGGGHRAHGRSASPTRRRRDYLHVAVDDHSRYAYVETLRFRTRGGRGACDNARNYTVARVFLAVAEPTASS